MTMNPRWTEEMDVELKRLVAAGATYAEIAREINDQFKRQLSRNATIGRAQRLGLCEKQGTRPKRVNVAKPAPAPSALPRLPGRFVCKPMSMIARAPVQPTANEAPAVIVPTAPAGRYTLLDRPPQGCCYPSGEGAAITFCGALQRAGSSYCNHHLRLCLSAEGFANLTAKGRAA